MPSRCTGVRKAAGLMSFGRDVIVSASRSSPSEAWPVASSVESLVSMIASSGFTTPSFATARTAAHVIGSRSSPRTITPSACATSMPAASTTTCEMVPSRTHACTVPSRLAIIFAVDLPRACSWACPPSLPVT